MFTDPAPPTNSLFHLVSTVLASHQKAMTLQFRTTVTSFQLTGISRRYDIADKFLLPNFNYGYIPNVNERTK